MEKKVFIAQETDFGKRLDKLLTERFPEKSRNYLQKLFAEGFISVDGKKTLKPSFKIEAGQEVEVIIPPPKEFHLKPLDMELNIVFENKDLLVINKPAGLVTHPGQGGTHLDDTLVNAVLHHCKGQLSGISGVMRPGIVHRLDKDTSGLILVAKNDKAHRFLAEQLKNRQIEKTYCALLVGHLTPQKGTIEAPIGRSTPDRKKMAVTSLQKGRNAVTHYEVLQYFYLKKAPETHYTYVKVRIITGRTHQIRVHFSSIGYPLVGDGLYGRAKVNKFFVQAFGLHRQFLHAQEIAFELPSPLNTPAPTKKAHFRAPLPSDLQTVLTKDMLKNGHFEYPAG